MGPFEAIWLLFGALVGFTAATKRGWSPVGGVIGGAILGILSPLLFFVSGVSRGDRSKVCPQCAERIKEAAKVCRFCGAQVDSHGTTSERGMTRWEFKCADRLTGEESVESIVAASESDARDALARRGKLVAGVVSAMPLGR